MLSSLIFNKSYILFAAEEYQSFTAFSVSLPLYLQNTKAIMSGLNEHQRFLKRPRVPHLQLSSMYCLFLCTTCTVIKHITVDLVFSYDIVQHRPDLSPLFNIFVQLSLSLFLAVCQFMYKQTESNIKSESKSLHVFMYWAIKADF